MHLFHFFDKPMCRQYLPVVFNLPLFFGFGVARIQTFAGALDTGTRENDAACESEQLSEKLIDKMHHSK